MIKTITLDNRLQIDRATSCKQSRCFSRVYIFRFLLRIFFFIHILIINQISGTDDYFTKKKRVSIRLLMLTRLVTDAFSCICRDEVGKTSCDFPTLLLNKVLNIL